MEKEEKSKDVRKKNKVRLLSILYFQERKLIYLALKMERVGELTSSVDNFFHDEMETEVIKLRRKLVRANLVVLHEGGYL